MQHTHLTINRASDIDYSNNVLHLTGTDVRGGSSYHTVKIVIPKVNIIYYTREEWTGDYGTSGSKFTFTTVYTTQISIKVNKQDVEKIVIFLKDWEGQFKSETANLLDLS